MDNASTPKPIHLGPKYAEQFCDESVVDAYRHRPPYPAEILSFLFDLLPIGTGSILDAGCGSGDLTLAMLANLPDINRIDAVDLSAAMIDVGRRRSGGDDPRLHWQAAPMETASLQPPYALVTAGESLHWMDWSTVLPRIRAALLPGGVLAIVGRDQQPAPWSDELLEIVQRYSTNVDFRPYNLVDELSSRALFTMRGRRTTQPVTLTQSIDGYIESWHSRNGLSRDRMTVEAASTFDAEVRDLLNRHGLTSVITFDIVGNVTWGLPAG